MRTQHGGVRAEVVLLRRSRDPDRKLTCDQRRSILARAKNGGNVRRVSSVLSSSRCRGVNLQAWTPFQVVPPPAMLSYNGLQKEDAAAAADDNHHAGTRNHDASPEQPNRSFQRPRFKSEDHLAHVRGSHDPKSAPGSPLGGLEADPSEVSNDVEDDVAPEKTEAEIASAEHHQEEKAGGDEERPLTPSVAADSGPSLKRRLETSLGAKELISTSRGTPNPHRDLKTYKKPPHASAVGKHSAGRPDAESEESEEPSDGGSDDDESDESDEAAPAAAAFTIDLSNSHTYLREDRRYVDLVRPVVQAPGQERRRSAAKAGHEAADKKELSFEVSEDDDRDERPAAPAYECKHCGRRGDSLQRMAAHYYQSHPYVRCGSDYIRDRRDRSATFRCLACPVEFPEESQLRRHYADRHAGAPDIFSLGRDQIRLRFKCFTCAFSAESLDALKEHYRDRHPPAKAPNGLMFLQYLAAPPPPRPEAPSPAPAYQCRRCPFRHRSVIVLQVHYQKNHPAEAVTIDEIKRWASEGQRASGNNARPPNVQAGSTLCAGDGDPGPPKVPEVQAASPSLKAEAPAPERGDSPRATEARGPAHPAPTATPKPKSAARNLYARPENLFFCSKCNYGNPTIKGVMVHQFRTHDKLRTGSHDIARYSREVHRGLREARARGGGGGGGDGPFSGPLLPPPILNEGDERTFFCHFCHYRRSTVSKVVQHYARRHGGLVATPKQIQAYTFRTLELLQKSEGAPAPGGGPKVKSLRCQNCPYKTRNAKLLRAHASKCRRGGGGGGGGEGVLKVYLTQGGVASGYRCHLCAFSHEEAAALSKHYRREHPGSRPPRPDWIARDADAYSCRACSFRGGSPVAIREHYRAVHPWCLKADDGGGRSQKDDPFDDYQIPLESPSTSPERIQSADGADGASRESERGAGAEDGSHVHVFKCPYCTYVNTKHQGVLTHCQMRHAALQSRADNLFVDQAHLRGWEAKRPAGEGRPSHFRGYMCPLCPLTHDSEKKLQRHRQRDHAESPPAPTAKSAASQIKMTLFRCQQCAYSCSNKAAFGRHVRLKHKGGAGHHQGGAVQLWRYRCALCAESYLKKKRLASHYKAKHGQDAYRKHFGPLYEQEQEQTPARVAAAGTSRRLVYKCPHCPYVNSRPHGMATHCQMMHPDLPVRVEELRRDEIVISSNYQAGSNNKRGYLCGLCQGICMSLKKLHVHRSKRHGKEDDRGRSRPSLDPAPEPKAPRKPAGSSFPCLLCSYSSLIRKRLAAHYAKRHGKKAFRKHFAPLYLRKARAGPPPPEAAEAEPPEPPPEGEEMLYACQLCDYRTWARRYLTYHYNKTHQLDPGTRDRLLMAYNKRKRPPPRDPDPDPDPEPDAPQDARPSATPARCKKCPDLSFESPQLLIAHYGARHGRPSDFAVVHPAGRNTGVYRCARCHKTLNGIRKLARHLDRHREKILSDNGKAKSWNPADAAAQELHTVQKAPREQEGGPPSPEKAARRSATEAPSPGETHACSQCQRTFKSRNGVRTHERSHEALAAIKKLPASLAQLNLTKYLLHKPGTIRPFQCSICFYRTNVMGLWNNHLLKKHLDIVLETCDDKRENSATADAADVDAPPLGSGATTVAKSNEGCSRDWYLEPPEVRRQLDHFSLMAQKRAAAASSAAAGGGGGPLRCENCSFVCEDLPTMRRHYLSRHGRKLLACKDCDFFTGLKRAMRVHVDTDHRKEAPPPEGLLRCPFCLYQSGDKNRMIDHVLLHREERVVPMEVRRAELSRYLRGLVFRCHLCTYTSGSAGNLRLHVAAKHRRPKPYRCRLCYFDCAGLADLEAHLCAEHQVMRNHELVGQVSLEQLEQVQLKHTPQEEEEEDHQEEEREQAQELDDDDAQDFLGRAEEEADGGKPAREGSRDAARNRLGQTDAQKEQNDANGGDDAHNVPPPEKRDEQEEAGDDEGEGGAEKWEEKAHGPKLQMADAEEDIRRRGPQPKQLGAAGSFSSGEEEEEELKAESSAKVAKKTLKRETSAPPRDDDARKRKSREQDGRGREGHKRLKAEERLAQLKGVAMTTFSCSLCGRNLGSEEEMQRHASRHGM